MMHEEVRMAAALAEAMEGGRRRGGQTSTEAAALQMSFRRCTTYISGGLSIVFFILLVLVVNRVIEDTKKGDPTWLHGIVLTIVVGIFIFFMAYFCRGIRLYFDLPAVWAAVRRLFAGARVAVGDPQPALSSHDVAIEGQNPEQAANDPVSAPLVVVPQNEPADDRSSSRASSEKDAILQPSTSGEECTVKTVSEVAKAVSNIATGSVSGVQSQPSTSATKGTEEQSTAAHLEPTEESFKSTEKVESSEGGELRHRKTPNSKEKEELSKSSDEESLKEVRSTPVGN